MMANVTTFIQYLAKLPAFKPRKNLAQKRISRAMRLQREHERQWLASNP